MMKRLILALAASLALGAPVAAKPSRTAPAIGEEASIPFATMRRGIRSFHAVDDSLVFIQDSRRNWYRAEVAGTCLGLSWAMRIGYDTRGSSNFDRGSSLIVGDERCQLLSLTRRERPDLRASKRSRNRTT